MKYTRDKAVDLKKLAQLGYQQIITKQYDQGLQPVICIGLAHRGKQVEVYTKQ